VRLYRQSELRELPAPRFLIPGWLVEHSLAQLSGPSGVGKTFVYTDWACRLAADGRRVLVIVGEGFYRYQSRLDAWQMHHHREVPNNNLIVAPDVPALPSDAQMGDLIAAIGRLRHPLDLIVVDTFAKAMSGYSEQDAADVTVALYNLTALRRAAGDATGLLVTHFGWEGTRQRGSSALYGECDTVVYLKKVGVKRRKDTPEAVEDDDEDGPEEGWTFAPDEATPRSRRARLCLEKQRDAPDDIPPVVLERTDVDLGYIEIDGEPARSCVYLPVRTEPRKSKARTNGHSANGHHVDLGKVIDLSDHFQK
jgi:hypothetical protein